MNVTTLRTLSSLILLLLLAGPVLCADDGETWKVNLKNADIREFVTQEKPVGEIGNWGDDPNVNVAKFASSDSLAWRLKKSAPALTSSISVSRASACR